MIDPNSPVFCKIQPAEGCKNETFFEVGKFYKLDSEPKIMLNGFHCCSNFLNVLDIVKIRRITDILKFDWASRKVMQQLELTGNIFAATRCT
mgnify:CR=1 FL=1|jgi:hypothetical protein